MTNLNKKFSEIKSLVKEGTTLISKIEEESVMFRATGNLYYQDHYYVKDLEYNLSVGNDMVCNIVDGFYSYTKEFDSAEAAEKEGYGIINKSVKVVDGRVLCEVGKFVTTIPESELQEKADYAWKNNISTDFSKYYKRVD